MNKNDVEIRTKQIARDICKDNKICTCLYRDGSCTSIMSIAKRLAEQGYRKPENRNVK